MLREDIKEALHAKFAGETRIQIANNVCYSGTKYAVGMILANGSTGGVTDFGELIQIVVVKGMLVFIVKCLSAWSIEHLRSYVLEKTHTVKVLEPAELSDIFPLTPYMLGGKKHCNPETLHLCPIECQHSLDLSNLEVNKNPEQKDSNRVFSSVTFI